MARDQMAPIETHVVTTLYGSDPVPAAEDRSAAQEVTRLSGGTRASH